MARQRKKKGDLINGVVLLDKPQGISSNSAVQKVKRLFNAQKAGHTGALDPLATGLLPVCLGEATKISQYLLDADKGYYVKAKLGAITTTADAEGEIAESFDLPTSSNEQFAEVVKAFVGNIQQVPPMFSALKYKGQPLYKLAREGKEIERKARDITIYSIDIVSYSSEEFELQVACSKGTYIRTLVEDIGKALNSGAYVLELRRTLAAPFSLEDCITLEALEGEVSAAQTPKVAKALKPVSYAIQHWPQLILTAGQAHDLSFGRRITLEPQQCVLNHDNELVGIFTNRAENQAPEFLGIGNIKQGILVPQRLIQHKE